MPYQKIQKDHITQFTITPEPRPDISESLVVVFGCFVFFFVWLILLGLVLSIFKNALGLGMFISLAGAAASLYFLKRILKSSGIGMELIMLVPSMKKFLTDYRKDYTFQVNSEQLEINGRVIPKSEIQRIIVRNHASSVVDQKLIGSITSNRSDIQSAKAYASQLYSKVVEPVSYRVDVETNGQVITIAGGVNDPTANGILIDIGNILGLK
jgi:hypothetical protein